MATRNQDAIAPRRRNQDKIASLKNSNDDAFQRIQ